MPVVLLDTNALFLPFQFHIDPRKAVPELLGKCDILVPDFVVTEIETMMKANVPGARGAHLYAFRYEGVTFEKIVKEKDFDLAQAGGSAKRWPSGMAPQDHGIEVDRKMVILAVLMKAYVLTCDNPLRKQLRKAGVPVIFVRNKKTLELDGQLEVV